MARIDGACLYRRGRKQYKIVPNKRKDLMIKSSSSDKIESPAKYFIRRQAQYFGGMALVHSTKLNRARWAQSSLVCGGRLAALSELGLSNAWRTRC